MARKGGVEGGAELPEADLHSYYYGCRAMPKPRLKSSRTAEHGLNVRLIMDAAQACESLVPPCF